VTASTVALAAALPAVPALGAGVGLLLPQRSRRPAITVALVSAGLTLLAAIALWVVVGSPWPITANSKSTVDEWVTLARFGDLEVTAGVRVDTVTVVVAIAVALVAFLVQLYSIGYLLGIGSPPSSPDSSSPKSGNPDSGNPKPGNPDSGSPKSGNPDSGNPDSGNPKSGGAHSDDRYAPYAAQISLFTAAMLLVVVSGDLLTLLIGWEVMGLCSYLLIGHDRSLPEAPGAAVKAFLVTRVGDIGFALGVVVLGTSAGGFRIATVLTAATEGRISGGTLTLASLLLLAGVAGKSALFPLHTWLPDAMAGPTPVSALIHAATMVAAGIYVVARLYGLFGSPALTVLAVLASVTMLLGACAACAQDDLKRVLAWSTVSQIAYLAAGLAVGGVDASLFHLLAHAGFKALLFLAAGAVIIAAGGNALAALGGLRTAMPVVFVTMTAGLAALAGVPPFSGFFSKEAILGAAHRAAEGHSQLSAGVGWVVLVSGLVTAGLTGAYTTRLWLRVFFGAHRSPGTVPSDPPWPMRAPLLILAVPAVLLGAWPPFAHAPLELGTTVVTLLLTGSGALAVWLVWRQDPAADPARALGPLREPFRNGFGIDTAQGVLVVRPIRALARAVSIVDERVVDGAVEGSGTGSVVLARSLTRWQAAGLGRFLTMTLGGSVLLAAAAVVVSGVLR
jgi:NADH-quinone oxidoreductase subunit L